MRKKGRRPVYIRLLHVSILDLHVKDTPESADSVATVSSAGVVTAAGNSEATIKAPAGGVTS